MLFFRKKFASDLSIMTDRTGIVVADSSSGSGPNSLPEGVRSRLSSHRSDHEIHTPEHRSLAIYRRSGTHQPQQPVSALPKTLERHGLETPRESPAHNLVDERIEQLEKEVSFMIALRFFFFLIMSVVFV